MTERVEAMAEPTSARPGTTRPGPVRRVGWVLAGTIGAAALVALLYAVSPTLMPPTLSLLSAAALGLVSGFMARWLLAGWRRTLQTAAAAASLAVALIFLNWLTGGLVGLRLTGRAGPDWGALALLVLGLAAGWLALRAWERPPAWPATATAARRLHANGHHPRLELPSLGLRLPTPLTWKARVERARRRRRAAVRLLGEVEHRCPYCLEAVERRDRRGVVVCPECKTHHHADCWAVTGMCQVPHQHA